jgi:hypothetical protein
MAPEWHGRAQRPRFNPLAREFCFLLRVRPRRQEWPYPSNLFSDWRQHRALRAILAMQDLQAVHIVMLVEPVNIL